MNGDLVLILIKMVKNILLLSVLLTSTAMFAETKLDMETIKAKIERNLPSVTVEYINQSPIPGIYEILSSGQILYVSADAKYLMSGKLFSIENGIRDLTQDSLNVIDMKVAPTRRAKIDAIKKTDMIIFKAANEKHRITVFTDVDCAYCRKLHKEMANYNKLGITIEYLGFPRAGLGSASHKKLSSVWCAKDRNEAMNRAKIDRKFGNDICDDPIAEHYKLVKQFGLTGTPAIILKSGRLMPGYANAKDLLEIIKEDELLLSKMASK